MEVSMVEYTSKPRVLVTDPIAAEGVAYLRRFTDVEERLGLAPAELETVIGGYEALVVRSETRVTAPIIRAARQLKIIGRAGIGVDNIDVEAATRQGIIVVNSPAGNIIAAAEHTMAMMLALVRHIPTANCLLKEGRWERSRFMGVELRQKMLGIIGLGKVGSEVARRARGLEMRVIAADPFASPEHATKLGVALVSLDELLAAADIVTLHTSLTAGTRGLLGQRELALMKPGARLINCARGGVVDEESLLAALEQGHLAGAALDVFSQEPPRDNEVLRRLIASERVIVTPHLGASTEEAQVTVAMDVAEQIVAVLHGDVARTAVNAPIILPETLKVIQPYIALVEKMGRLYTQLHPGPLRHVELTCSGELAEYDHRLLKVALIKGLLESVSEAHVNVVNAQVLAKQWGLEVAERSTTEPEQYANLVTVRVTPNGEEHVLAGTIMWGDERIVRVDKYATDFGPQGRILICRNMDRPGMIGKVGTILGNANVNIKHMDVGPERVNGERRPGGEALMILSVDDEIPQWALDQIRATPDIFGLTMVRL
jgi:D-3-phosphoglycerate dehydrogenase